MKTLPISAALLGTLLSTATIAAANDDGSYNVTYNNIAFDLTQIGGYGELIIKPNGFGKMAYGNCSVNFKRDANGAPIEMTPVVQGSSAKCPDSLAFSVAAGEKGLYKIKFTDGGDLAGESFDLFPVLRPLTDELAVTAPKGFDILGNTIGMSRGDFEAKMSAEGYTSLQGYDNKSEYTDGTVRIQAVWSKGTAESGNDPEDSIGVTYSMVPAGEEQNAVVEVLARDWKIPATANLSVANLKKSLAEKHGAVTSQFDSRHYSRAGELVPDAFQAVCANDVHLQKVSTVIMLPGSSEELSVTPSCGASVDIMVLESFTTPGLANRLQVKLVKGDVAYKAFWDSWSKQEAAELQKRYDIQAGMNAEAPKL